MSNGCGWPKEHCDYCAEAEEMLKEQAKEEAKAQAQAARRRVPDLPETVFVPVPELTTWLKRRWLK